MCVFQKSYFSEPHLKLIVDKIGAFDESFFMYGEDLDFCYRIKQIVYKIIFNPITSIIYGINESMDVQIEIYDISGEKVESLINKFQVAGYYSVDWNADYHPS